jgi:hypothetical protein
MRSVPVVMKICCVLRHATYLEAMHMQGWFLATALFHPHGTPVYAGLQVAQAGWHCHLGGLPPEVKEEAWCMIK